MSKRTTRLLSLILTLVMFLSVATPAYAWGPGDFGGGWDRDIGEDEIRDPDFGPVEDVEEYDYFQALDEENNVQVTIEAPMGSLPSLAEVRLEAIPAVDLQEAVDAMVEGTPRILVAMDISFWLGEDEIEPEEPVRVKISAPELEGKTNLQVIHFPDDAEEPETVQLIPEEDLTFALGTNEVAFQADSFSVYVVVDDGSIDDNSRLTVNFINPHLEGENKIVATVYVKNSDTLEDLEKIVYDPGIGEEFDPEDPVEKNYMFRGWSIDAADANPQPQPTTEDPNPAPIPYGASYNSKTKSYSVEDLREYLLDKEISEGQVLNVYAMLFQKATVTYLGQDPDVSLGSFAVLRTLTEASVAYEVNMLYTPDENDENFEGWMIFNPSEKDHILSATYGETTIPKPYKASTEENPTLFPNTTILEINGDLTLSVSTPKGSWLIFNENGKGATYNAPIFVKAGQHIEKPTLAEDANMERNGYTFGGWYTDEACTDGNEFDFYTILQKNTIIYAKWTVKSTAPYTVVIWKQNVAGDGYDFEESFQLTGNSNQAITTVSVSGTPGSDSAYARVTGRPKGTDIQFTGFHLKEITYANSKDDDHKVAPEGNTIVNIYYDRTKYTLTFQDYTYTQNNNGTYVYWPGGYYRTGNYYYTYYYFPEGYYSRDTYYGTDEGNYGEGPSPVYSVNNNATVTYYTKNANGYTSHTYTAHRYNRSNNRTTVKTITAVYEGNIIAEFPIVGTNSMTYDDGQRWEPVGSSSFSAVLLSLELMPAENVTFYMNPGTKRPLKTMNYYVEALPDDTTNIVTYQNTRYKLYSSRVARYNYVTESEDFIDLKGFTKVTSNPAYGSNGRALDDSSADGTINMYYSRNKYQIHYMDGGYYDGDNKPIADEISLGDMGYSDLEYYDSDITAYNQGGAKAKTPTKYGYVFEGWYLDSSCSTAAKFNRMPDGGITVYAKWRIVQFRVFLHPNAGDSAATADPTLSWGKDENNQEVDQAMNFRKSNGEFVSLPTGTRDTYEFVGWYTDEAFEHPFNADVVSLSPRNVTTPYDMTVDKTDNAEMITLIDSSTGQPYQDNKPINRWGYLEDEGVNKDYDKNRFWITAKLDLYAKWKAKLEGAEGIAIIYDVGEGSGEIVDPMLYEDNSKAIAQQASTPPAVGEGERELQFSYWLVQKWNGTAFEDTEEHVYPADNFVVHVANARKSPIMDGDVQATDPAGNKLYEYAIQLRAVYEPKDAPEPTYITWYSNVYDAAGNEIPNAENILTATNPSTQDMPYTPYENGAFVEGKGKGFDRQDVQINKAILIPPADTFKMEGYNFLGWGKIDKSQSSGPNATGILNNKDLSDENLFLKWVPVEGETNGGHYEALLPKDNLTNDSTLSYTTGDAPSGDIAPMNLRAGEEELEWKKVTAVAADEDNPYQDLYAVWGGEFKVYHSGIKGGAVETYQITRANKTLDLTRYYTEPKRDETDPHAGEYKDSGFLYGGYYLKGGFTAPAMDDKGVPTADCAAYNGANWTWNTAQTENGMKLQPKAGVTYYIKEVPADKYELPYLHYTYKTGYDLITAIWLVSNIDDAQYKEVGFVVDGELLPADISQYAYMGKACNSLTITAANDPDHPFKLTPNVVFGVDDGHLTYRKVMSAMGPCEVGEGKLVRQYWVTLDNVLVTGAVGRYYTNMTTTSIRYDATEGHEANVTVNYTGKTSKPLS